MERDGVVDGTADLLLGEACHNGIAISDADHVLMEDVVVAQTRGGEWFRGESDPVEESGRSEGILVSRGIGAAGGIPSVEKGEFRTEDRSLDGVDAEIPADDLVVVALLHAVVADSLKLLSHLRVKAESDAGIAGRTEILARIEADIGGGGDDAGGLRS